MSSLGQEKRKQEDKATQRKIMTPKEQTTTKGALGETRRTTGRRRFLHLAGAALLAGSALPKSAEASIHHVGGDFT